MFVVSVPVLSEQMTEVHPRVSTDGKDLTMAFFLAMRRVPRARQVVMTAGRPVVGAKILISQYAGDGCHFKKEEVISLQHGRDLATSNTDTNLGVL